MGTQQTLPQILYSRRLNNSLSCLSRLLRESQQNEKVKMQVRRTSAVSSKFSHSLIQSYSFISNLSTLWVGPLQCSFSPLRSLHHRGGGGKWGHLFKACGVKRRGVGDRDCAAQKVPQRGTTYMHTHTHTHTHDPSII